MDGGSNLEESARRLGLPVELVAEAEGFAVADGIYPDNMQPVRVFAAMLTQWRVGPGGAVGFDYGVLPVVFRIKGVTATEEEDVFDCLTVMEHAALKHFRNT